MVRHRARAASCRTAKAACFGLRTAAPPGSASLMAGQYATSSLVLCMELPWLTPWVVVFEACLLQSVSACNRHRVRIFSEILTIEIVVPDTAGRRAICYCGQRAGLHGWAGAKR